VVRAEMEILERLRELPAATPAPPEDRIKTLVRFHDSQQAGISRSRGGDRGSHTTHKQGTIMRVAKVELRIELADGQHQDRRVLQLPYLPAARVASDFLNPLGTRRDATGIVQACPTALCSARKGPLPGPSEPA
jgi:hypothetical protein